MTLGSILKILMTSGAWVKYGILFLGVMFVRLLPFRAPNVEPLLSAVSHLSGAILFAAVVSPLLYRWLQESEVPAVALSKSR